MNETFKRNLFISTGISILILIISSTASFLSIQNLLDSNKKVNSARDFIKNLNESHAIFLEAQTSVRGYIITGDANFLEFYTDAYSRARPHLDAARLLALNHPLQRQNMDKMEVAVVEYFDYLRERVDEKATGKAIDPNALRRGKYLIDKIGQDMKQMEAIENKTLQEKLDMADRYGTFSIVLVVFAAVIALIISSIFFRRIYADFRVRHELQQELERTHRETDHRIHVISDIASQISKGNYTVRIEDNQTDALGSVGGSLNQMATALEHSFKQLSDKEWLQTGVAKLNNVMLGEKTPRQLTSDIIEFVSRYTESNAGAIYLLSDQQLHAWSGFSYKPTSRQVLQLGEGLSGQAAASGIMQEIKGISPEGVSISYAMGEIKPAHVVAIPLKDDQISGVMELATINNFGDREIEFMKTVSNNIGIAIKAALNRNRVQELLEETQAQTEELTAQHSELESINAELEAQTEKLQASEEELRVQQEELQQTNEELSERSALLEERNLEIQRKSEDLELSTRYKSEFLANMSHELRTPLNSILLLSRLLSENNEQNLSAEQIEFAKVIQSSGTGLLGLIDEILDLSKIEAGKMDLELADISVGEVTTNMRKLFGEMARQKGIALKIEDQGAPVVIKTDLMRLEQILKNLLSNAVKFTSEGSVTLRVSKEGNQVKFSVIDTGIGIQPEKQMLIFDAFQQADGSTKRKYGGTGLGLSISRELAKLLNGVISLRSTVNQGSEFTLALPLTGPGTTTSADKPAKIDDSLPTATEDQQKPQYISKTIPDEIPDDRNDINPGDKVILIVEDDVAFAKSLLDFTRTKGYKGVVCVRGDQALNMALAFKPTGVLLDIELPIVSGWEVIEQLKENRQTRHVPVHMMSSHKMRRESLLKGAINFLDKPVAFEQMPEIFQRIEQIIHRDSQKVLIIEDNPKHAQALSYFLESHDIRSEIKSEIAEGFDVLQRKEVDCVILDMGIPDPQGYEILENIKKNQGMEDLPVIVFTGKSLSMKEELKIKKYADSIVVKTAHSYKRMLDEVSLFLHLMEEPEKSKKRGNKNQNGLTNVLSDKKVLVVDDDVRNIYSLTKALELLNMRVLTAIDGKEALLVLVENPDIDVVLLDMMMPNMDGYETARHIREQHRFKNLPVIAVTAKAMTGDREKCISAGASDYITKPVDIDQLLSLLRVWLYDKS
jgi:signal transduction histidine kinase/CheY-like chemotaxis protein/CHASE3 domain sensor protein/HAMP domain-containing protein